uniref:Uncharacterized protein n=1 Tax=Aegilops tauschii subsp. strangulata TaxID=200361 RepID=A0A453PA47_AEGTS
MLPRARIRPREIRTLRIRPPPRRIQRYLYGDPAFSSPLPQALNRPVPEVREALLAEEVAPGMGGSKSLGVIISKASSYRRRACHTSIFRFGTSYKKSSPIC